MDPPDRREPAVERPNRRRRHCRLGHRAARGGGLGYEPSPPFWCPTWPCGLSGGVVYVLYRPHGYAATGVITVAAGLYELTPLKAHFRRCSHHEVASGQPIALAVIGLGALVLVMPTAIAGLGASMWAHMGPRS